MTDIAAWLRAARVLPILTIDDAAHARPVAEALRDGGLTTFEITLRTACALDAIREAATVDGVTVGAGTVLNAADLDAALAAGARFAVAPGLTDALVHAAQSRGAALLPGVATASDLMRGLDLGLRCFKFFPAAHLGGPAALAALAAPFPQARFCPTGGITRDAMKDWFALPSVLCVGGSWMVGKGAPDRAAITAAARAASGA